MASVDGLASGSWDGGVIDELEPTPNDLYVDKVRFDAFLWTSLDPLLQGLGVSDLVVCGVVTNVCVESTVRAGFMKDYPITLLEDCCASRTTRRHEIGVEAMRDLGFATIASISGGFALASTREAATAAA